MILGDLGAGFRPYDLDALLSKALLKKKWKEVVPGKRKMLMVFWLDY